MKVSELEDQAIGQAKLIKTLQTEHLEIKNGLNDMSKELEIKVKEILQVRSEANQTLKYDAVCGVLACLAVLIIVVIQSNFSSVCPPSFLGYITAIASDCSLLLQVE